MVAAACWRSCSASGPSRGGHPAPGRDRGGGAVRARPAAQRPTTAVLPRHRRRDRSVRCSPCGGRSLVVMLIWRRWRHLFVWIGTHCRWSATSTAWPTGLISDRGRSSVEILGSWAGLRDAVPAGGGAEPPPRSACCTRWCPAGGCADRGKWVAAGLVALVRCRPALPGQSTTRPTSWSASSSGSPSRCRLPAARPQRGLPGHVPARASGPPGRERRPRRGDLPGAAGPARAWSPGRSSRSGWPARPARPRCGSRVKGDPDTLAVRQALRDHPPALGPLVQARPRRCCTAGWRTRSRSTRVRRLVQHEDYVLRMMQRRRAARRRSRYGFVEITPEREYLLVTEFFAGAREIGDADVDDGVIDQGLADHPEAVGAGLAHRDIKPANLLVRDGTLLADRHGLRRGAAEPVAAGGRPGEHDAGPGAAQRRPRASTSGRCGSSPTSEIAEAFAATRGLTMPSQLRRMIRERRAATCTTSFTWLLPDRLPPIRIQRWTCGGWGCCWSCSWRPCWPRSRHRAACSEARCEGPGAAVPAWRWRGWPAGAATPAGRGGRRPAAGLPHSASPGSDSAEAGPIAMAQSVPSAQWLPCVRDGAGGLDVHFVESAAGRSGCGSAPTGTAMLGADRLPATVLRPLRGRRGPQRAPEESRYERRPRVSGSAGSGCTRSWGCADLPASTCTAAPSPPRSPRSRRSSPPHRQKLDEMVRQVSDDRLRLDPSGAPGSSDLPGRRRRNRQEQRRTSDAGPDTGPLASRMEHRRVAVVPAGRRRRQRSSRAATSGRMSQSGVSRALARLEKPRSARSCAAAGRALRMTRTGRRVQAVRGRRCCIAGRRAGRGRRGLAWIRARHGGAGVPALSRHLAGAGPDRAPCTGRHPGMPVRAQPGHRRACSQPAVADGRADLELGTRAPGRGSTASRRGADPSRCGWPCPDGTPAAPAPPGRWRRGGGTPRRAATELGAAAGRPTSCAPGRVQPGRSCSRATTACPTVRGMVAAGLGVAVVPAPRAGHAGVGGSPVGYCRSTTRARAGRSGCPGRRSGRCPPAARLFREHVLARARAGKLPAVSDGR